MFVHFTLCSSLLFRFQHTPTRMSFPLKVKELVQLTDYGIEQNMIEETTMQSDKFVVCRGKAGNSSQVTIIDLEDPLNPMRKPISVDSVIMHPTQRIIACRTGQFMGIFDVEKEVKLKEDQNNGKVVFWKWLNEETLGFCTNNYVFTWSLQGNSPTVQAFKRIKALAGKYIVDYVINDERKWHALVAGPRPTEIWGDGKIQLYHAPSGVVQLLDGFAACFCKFTFKDKSKPSNLLVHSTKNNTKGKLCVKELNLLAPKQELASPSDEPFMFDIEEDYPINLQVSLHHGLIYLVTKLGFVHLFDIESRIRLYSIRFSQVPLFAVVKQEKGGIIGINGNGQVLSVSLNQSTMLKYVGKTKPTLVSKLYMRWTRIEDAPKNPVPLKTLATRPVLPSAPCLSLDDAYEVPPRIPVTSTASVYDQPPITSIAPSSRTAPVYDIPPMTSNAPITSTAPVYDRPPDVVNARPFLIPPSQIHLYAMPPPYSPRETPETVVTPRDSERRAAIAERERDKLAKQLAELEMKYREALTLKEQTERQGCDTQNRLRF